MIGCTTSNNLIKIYPYKTTADNVDTYHLYAYFENNMFNNNTPITFTRYDTEDGWESKCYECEVDWTIKSNTFNGNEDGISCRYWAKRAGSYYNKTFIKLQSYPVVNHISISGNTGNCPDENFYGMYIAPGSNSWQVTSEGSSTYWYPTSYRRVFTALRGALNDSFEYSLKNGNGLLDSLVSRFLASDTRIDGHLHAYVGHVARNEVIEDGDLFKCTPVMLGNPGEYEHYAKTVTYIQ